MISECEQTDHLYEYIEKGQDVFICSICGDKSYDQEELELHMAVEHDDDEWTPADNSDLYDGDHF